MQKERTVRSFDEAMTQVTTDILRMGRLALAQLGAAVALLDKAKDIDPDEIAAMDDQVDEFDERIEHEVRRVLVLRQPMADDLRTLLSFDRMATDLERIADHAKNIAKRAGHIREQGHTLDFGGTKQLASEVITQLEAMLHAVETKDAAAARSIWARDADIDQLFEETFNQQIAGICQAAETAPSCAHALFIDKSLERVGDHVTNIAEDLIYMVTGERMKKRDTPDPV